MLQSHLVIGSRSMHRLVSTIAIELYAVCRMNVTTRRPAHRKVIEVTPETGGILEHNVLGLSIS